TDYNEGRVMAFAINMGVTIQGDKRADDTIKLKSEGFGEDTFTVGSLVKNPRVPWSDYCKGVLKQLVDAGAPIGGFEAEITSTLPNGAGMSSSAAVEVAMALFVQKLFDFQFGEITDPEVRMGIARIC